MNKIFIIEININVLIKYLLTIIIIFINIKSFKKNKQLYYYKNSKLHSLYISNKTYIFQKGKLYISKCLNGLLY